MSHPTVDCVAITISYVICPPLGAGASIVTWVWMCYQVGLLVIAYLASPGG